MYTSKQDKLIILFFIWTIISGCLISAPPYNYHRLTQSFIVLGLYLFVRCIPQKKLMSYAIILAGLLQSLWTIGQQIHICESSHAFFSITGFMGNPGPLGGFQAITFIIATSTLQYAQLTRRIKYTMWPIIAIIGYSIIIADSRASWLATGLGCITVYHRQIRSILVTHRKAIFVVTICLIAGLISLYCYRSGSANSRLLIWRVCFDMIIDKPLWGHGLGGFTDKYMLYQADFFSTYPNSIFRGVADNVAYAYNEILHIWIELGVIGVVLMVMLAYHSFIHSSNRIKAALTTMIVFSLFSYPSSVDKLLYLYAVVLALTSEKPLLQLEKFWNYAISILILLAISYAKDKENRYIQEAHEHLYTLMAGKESPQSIVYINKHIKAIAAYPQLNTMYAYVLSEHPEFATEVNLSHIIPSSEHWCDKGVVYQSKGEYNKAIHHFKKAADMVPTRFRPNYLLWKLYVKCHQHSEARHVAKELLNQKLKVENTFTLRCKAELRKYLAEYKN